MLPGFLHSLSVLRLFVSFPPAIEGGAIFFNRNVEHSVRAQTVIPQVCILKQDALVRNVGPK